MHSASSFSNLHLWFVGQDHVSARGPSSWQGALHVHRPRSHHPSMVPSPPPPWFVSSHVSSFPSCSSSSGVVLRMGHHVANGVCSHVAGSYPLPPNGWQRANLHVVMIAPRVQPYLANACMAYSEHVGTYRQLGGSIGDTAALYHRRNVTAAWAFPTWWFSTSTTTSHTHLSQSRTCSLRRWERRTTRLRPRPKRSRLAPKSTVRRVDMHVRVRLQGRQVADGCKEKKKINKRNTRAVSLVRCYRGSQPHRCHEAYVRFWRCYQTKRVRVWTTKAKQTCAHERWWEGEDVDGMETQGWNDNHVAWWTRWFGDADEKKMDQKPDT